MAEPIVPVAVQTLASQLADPKPMRRGSLSERYVKCNRAGCPCTQRENARHGPYYSVSRVVRGKTKSRWLDAEQARVVRQQIETGQQFRQRIDEYWEASERWADAQLEAVEATSKEVAKKGGSKKRSTRRSSTKSRR